MNDIVVVVVDSVVYIVVVVVVAVVVCHVVVVVAVGVLVVGLFSCFCMLSRRCWSSSEISSSSLVVHLLLTLSFTSVVLSALIVFDLEDKRLKVLLFD